MHYYEETSNIYLINIIHYTIFLFFGNYILENNLLCLNTYYQKRKGQLRTHKSPNGNKVQLDYIMINRKWKNSSKNCRDYGSFESIASDHRSVSAHLKLSLRSNKKKTIKTPIYDWTTLKNPYIQKKFICEVLKSFKTLTMKHPTYQQILCMTILKHLVEKLQLISSPSKKNLKIYLPGRIPIYV